MGGQEQEVDGEPSGRVGMEMLGIEGAVKKKGNGENEKKCE